MTQIGLSSWRTFRWSVWLGWQIESNWADFRLFLLYMVIKPISGSLVLVCMYFAAQYATNGAVPVQYLPYIYVSNSCYALVSAIMFGMSTVVIRDRESYRMLKYIVMSPSHFPTYFVGRGFASFSEGALGALITLLAGLSLPVVRDQLTGVDLGWLLAYGVVGSVMLWSLGMLFASAMLNLPRNAMFLSEGISAIVYFLSGVIFPIMILPAWLKPMSLILPTTHWLEGMRRAILGRAPEGSPLAASPLAAWSNWELLALLSLTTGILVLIAIYWYRWNVRKAWSNGKFEETTGM
jgi:ABC-2 type transport system permease protein